MNAIGLKVAQLENARAWFDLSFCCCKARDLLPHDFLRLLQFVGRVLHGVMSVDWLSRTWRASSADHFPDCLNTRYRYLASLAP